MKLLNFKDSNPSSQNICNGKTLSSFTFNGSPAPYNLTETETTLQSSCEFCEMFYNDYFIEHLLATAYENFLTLLCSTYNAINYSKISLKESLKDNFIVCLLKNLVNTISCHWSLSIHPAWKNQAFWCFQGVQKETSGMKWIEIRLKDLLGNFIAYLEVLQGSVKTIWSLIFVL